MIRELPILCVCDVGQQAAAKVTVEAFGKLMVSQLIFHGFPLDKSDQPPAMYYDQRLLDQELDGALRRAASKGFRLLLVILPEKNISIYTKIKQAATLRFGINTVCCTLSNTKKLDKNIASNIALKINIKSGGINQTVAPNEFSCIGLKMEDVVVMGADVIHLGRPGNMSGCPSIACVVGSVDSKFTTYLCSMRLQRSLQEVRYPF